MNNRNYAYANHSSVLKKARLKVLIRAHGKCEVCGQKARVVHHQDGSTVNHALDNLTALCVACHNAVHMEDCGLQKRKTRSKYTRLFGCSLSELSRMTGLSPWTIQARWLNDPEKKTLLLKAAENPETAARTIGLVEVTCPPSILNSARDKFIRRHSQNVARA